MEILKYCFLFQFYILLHFLSITDQGVNCSPLDRIDCHPDPGSNQESCTVRGCIFDTNIFDSTINIPQCYFPRTTGYIAEVNVNSSNSITLKKSASSPKNPFGQDFDELVFQSTEIGSGLFVSIAPKGVVRYRPPVPINYSPQITSSDKLNIGKQNNSIFSFSVQRQSTGTKIWDTQLGGLLFSDKFIQIASYLPTDKIYGFGEHLHTSIKHNISAYITWGMWARDNGGVHLRQNLYGVHPFYMILEDDSNAHGVFIFNSNAQEVTLGPGPHLVYRTIGGQLDIFYFPGPTPEQVIQQYQQVIGTPFLPSYWALGFHICRWGYQGTHDVQAVVNRTLGFGIPFDVTWADIDYMERYKDFTLGATNWGDFGNYTDYLHSQGMHVILITDPAIEVDYSSFQRGLEQGASFIEWPRADMVPQTIENQYPLTNGTKIMLGLVWPDKHVAFPDFLDPTGKTNQWWSNEFANFRQTVAIDGVWIDMNEPSNFDTGFYNSSSYKRKFPKNQPLNCPASGADSIYDVPPYLTWSGYNNGPYLATDTICLCAVAARGNLTLYNVKNLYGWSEMVATALAQNQAIGKRGAVISRSTFPSSGSYGGHWTGDNHATWDDLKYSMIAIQEFNMFGIPFVGADICGFHGNTTEELCLRWQQLGAFYPFSRNHNENTAIAQDPGIWPSVAAATRKANTFRYRHLPYLYSLFFNASLNGGTVARPAFFEFPNDAATLELSYQFMWGSAMMIIPVTDESADEVNGYLPNSTDWFSVYDYFYGTLVNNGYQTFPAPTEYLIPVFVRAGYVIPRQYPAITTTLSRQNPLQILVALDKNIPQLAHGELFWDDGETVVTNIKTYNYNHYEFNFSATNNKATLNITQTKQGTGLTLPTLDNIEVFNYLYTPNLSTAKLNGNPITINTALSSYSPFTKVLNITTSNFINLNNNGPSWIITWNNQ